MSGAVAQVPDYVIKGAGEPTLVFLHGLGGTKDYFRATIDLLARRHRCVAWSMPGYAESAPLEDVTFEALAQAAVAMLIDAGIDRAVFIGHSAGGMVAQELWARAPQRIAGLVLIGTVPAFAKDERFVRGFLDSRLAPIEAGQTPADIAREVIGGLVAAEIPAEAMAHACGCMGSISADAYAKVVRCLTTFDRSEQLASISVPTLVVSASADRTAPSKVMARMAALIPGAEHVEIDGAGHLIDLERPEPFHRALTDFLSEHWHDA
jgi:3-oxoadipate enol-lactonase